MCSQTKISDPKMRQDQTVKQPKKNSTKNTGYTAFKFPDLVIKKCLIPKNFLDNVSEMLSF